MVFAIVHQIDFEPKAAVVAAASSVHVRYLRWHSPPFQVAEDLLVLRSIGFKEVLVVAQEPVLEET